MRGQGSSLADGKPHFQLPLAGQFTELLSGLLLRILGFAVCVLNVRDADGHHR